MKSLRIVVCWDRRYHRVTFFAPESAFVIAILVAFLLPNSRSWVLQLNNSNIQRTPFRLFHRKKESDFSSDGFTDSGSTAFGRTFSVPEQQDNNNGKRNYNEDDDDGLTPSMLQFQTFRRRKMKFQLQTRQEQWKQPPNPLLDDPIDFVQALLQALSTRPTRGTTSSAGSSASTMASSRTRARITPAMILLQSSTPSWRQVILRSIGAPKDATEDVAQTLQTALERPDNQFAILLNNKNHELDRDEENGKCCWYFPSDPLDFHDGHCWVESRLRTLPEDELLVATGWSLQRRTTDGAWLLNGVDWQDFRDGFRPGIGREEWERICG